MTRAERHAYRAERNRVYRWREQLETHLEAIEKLLARRPTGKDARYGALPELPPCILKDWDLWPPHGRPGTD